MAFSSNEKFIIDNQFGAVTDRQVICFANKSWFNRGSREYILLDKIFSVRYRVDRNPLLIALYIIIFTALKILPLGILFSILPLWGSPRITIVTNNRKTRIIEGFPWEKKEAEAFSDALCKQLALLKDGSVKQNTPQEEKFRATTFDQSSPSKEEKENLKQSYELVKELGAAIISPNIQPEIPTPEPSSPSPKQRLLLAAKENKGSLSLAGAALATGLEHDELKALLEECVAQGYAEIVTNPETGKISYLFDF